MLSTKIRQRLKSLALEIRYSRANGRNFLPEPEIPLGWRVAEEDFIQEHFDFSSAPRPTDLLIILSTPRSGSTFLSSLLFEANFGLPHEYLQASQYMQILNDRWNFTQERTKRINWRNFVIALADKRTSQNGWLAINAHASHLPRLSKALPYWSDLNWHVVHLERKDTIGQAISWCEARTKRKWTNDFLEIGEWHYDFHEVKSAYDTILAQNSSLSRIRRLMKSSSVSISYEEVIRDPVRSLERITSKPRSDFSKEFRIENIGLKKQSHDDSRALYRERFMKDLASI